MWAFIIKTQDMLKAIEDMLKAKPFTIEEDLAQRSKGLDHTLQVKPGHSRSMPLISFSLRFQLECVGIYHKTGHVTCKTRKHVIISDTWSGLLLKGEPPSLV